jgi:hypothetical protein
MKEHLGFIGTFKIARLPTGARVLDISTYADYKITNGEFDERKIRLCFAKINKQEDGTHWNHVKVYASVMKTPKVLIVV